MIKHKDLISIITPMYNSEMFIIQTIESVLSQTYTEWEMIIVDDASSDNSVNVVREYMKHNSRIKLIALEQNAGPAVARNKAIFEAKGKYIAFLDSDDYWDAQKLEKQIAFMQRNQIAFSFTNYFSVEEQTQKILQTIVAPKKIDYKTLLKKNTIGCLTVIYDTDVLGKIFMPLILKRQDYALWLKILKQIPYGYGMNEPLAYYNVRNISISSNKLTTSLYNWKLYREIEKLPLHKAIYYFGWYIYKSFLKYKNSVL